MRKNFSLVSGLCLVSALTTTTASAQPSPDGYDWVTIGAPNNLGYDGPDPFSQVTGRGSVPYEYRIARTELTTAQYMEFLNTFKARPDFVPDTVLPRPAIWGAEVDPNYTGPGTRYRLSGLPNAGMVPVGGLSWRNAARLANWLSNNKSTELSAINDGAYNVATFGTSSPGVYTDQPVHHPTARYYIPNLNEWLKSVHFDPNGNGPEQHRWWQQPNGTDTELNYGPPGMGEANSGFIFGPGNNDHYYIPLGSYPMTTSPWGLLDAAGGTMEWLEDVVFDTSGFNYRQRDGTYYGLDGGNPARDLAYAVSAGSPIDRSIYGGVRLASTVPAPAGACLTVAVLWFASRRRRSA